MATTFPVGADTSKAVSDIDKLIKELRLAGKEAGLTEAQINKMVETTKSAADAGVKGVGKMKEGFNDLNGTVKAVGSTLVAVFAADQLKQFVSQVIDITSQFQRLEAVLTNTLGSSSKARAALADIQALAAKTPFSVLELTENFIKLANRGVRPTMEQMTKLGDVAATLGKPFEQVVEALLDINNPERWKEIGIKAETAGNKVKLTFRDTTVEVNRTVQGVTDAVVALGEMQGVAGSMAAISETLGGKISNLGDAWDNFLKTVGDSEKGVLNGVVNLLTQAVNKAQELIETDSQKADKNSLAVYNEQLEKVKAIYETTKDINVARDQAIAGIHQELQTIDAQIKKDDLRIAFYGADPSKQELLNQLQAERNQLMARYNALVNEGQKAVLEFATETEKSNKPKPFQYTAEQLKIQEQVNERQKQYTREFENRAQQEEQDRKDKLKFLEDYKAGLEDLKNRFGKDAIKNISDDDVQGLIDSVKPELEAGAEGTPEAIAIANEVKQDIEKQHQAKIRAIKQETFDFIISGIQGIQQITQAQYQQDIMDLQAQQQYELSLAGNNENAKAQINKKFADKQKQLQREQAERSRELATIDIILNTARGVTAALASVPPNVPLSIFVGATGLIQLAIANATKLPKFAEGVFGLDGHGTDTSDNIMSMLSPGESVVSAKKSRKFKHILKPMIEQDLDLMDVRNIIDKSLPSSLAPAIYLNAKGADTKELIEEMRATREAIINKRETRITLDEDGFGVYVGRQESWTKYVAKRYKM